MSLMNIETRSILTRTKELLDKGWTRQANARDDEEQEVSVIRDNATCFCLEGALLRALHEHGVSRDSANEDAVFERVQRHLPTKYNCLFAWNDEEGRTKEEVIAVVDKALVELAHEASFVEAVAGDK